MTGQEQSRPRIFISYGRKDASDLATRLKNELLQKQFDVWLDASQLRAGKAWEKQIEEGLRKTDVVVALLSPHSTRVDNMGSGDGVCLDELAMARYSQPAIPIVPVLAVNGASIPLTIFRLHYIDFVGALASETSFQGKFEQLLSAIEGALSGRTAYRSWDQWLHAGPDFDRFLYSKHQRFIGRDWLFHKIDDWQRNTSEPALLIKGNPGIGKSSIIAELAFGRLDVATTATYCCQFDVPETLRPATFVRSVAFQLASRIPSYADAIEDPEIRRMLENSEVDPPSAFELAVLAPLARLQPPSGSALLFIDALDEAVTIREGPSIVSLLESRIDRLPPWLRIVATTRTDKTVMRQLGGLRAAEINAVGEDNMNDLTAYVADRLANSKAQSALSSAGIDAGDFMKSLVQRSEGSFLYAELFVRGMLRGQILPAELDSLPPGLDGTYESYLRRAFPNAPERSEIRPVLEILCAASEPIPLSVTADAAAMTLRAVTKRMAPLTAFLLENDLSTGDPLLGFRHKSFHDFLTDIANAETDFAVDPTEGHRKLASHFVKIVDAAPDLAAAVIKLPLYLRRRGLDHLALSGAFFDDLSAEQIASLVYCASWTDGAIAVGGLPALASSFVSSAISAGRLSDLERLVNTLHQATLRHYGDSGLLKADLQSNGKIKLTVTSRATESAPLRRALMTTGHAVWVVDQVRAQTGAGGRTADLTNSLGGLQYLVGGIHRAGWADSLSGYFEDQAYALDIMMSNLTNGLPAKSW